MVIGFSSGHVYVPMDLFDAMDIVCEDLALASFERDVAPCHPCPVTFVHQNSPPVFRVMILWKPGVGARVLLFVGSVGSSDKYEWRGERWTPIS